MEPSEQSTNLPALSPDDWRRVFSWLGWRDLCTCSCVCHAWRSLACDDALWQQQLRTAYHRPLMLPTLQHLAAGSTATGQQPTRQSGQLPATAPLKQAFAQHLALPAASHQALLARFHAAMQHITGWRLLISLTEPTANPQAAAGGGAAGDAAAGPPASTPLQQQQQRQLIGHPMPLTLPGLAGSAGWCVGCAMQQAQEQSVWVRFYLPPGLQEDEQVQAAAAAGRLRAAVQALGPAGWFDVACCHPFKIQQDDMLTLLQSHQSGFYAWDAADTAAAEGEDRFEDAAREPLPWDLPGGSHQLRQQPQQPQQQQLQQSQQPQQPQQQQPVKLRMLVYIHYEQLLQCLPPAFSALPLPVVAPPARAPGERLPIGCLWLHLDVCQLHGGFRVGTCVAPLLLARIGSDSVVLEASPQSVLAALVRPDSAAGSGSGVAGGSSSSGGSGCLADELQVLAVGQRVLVGASGQSSEGLLLTSAADVLLDLITRDEVMVDFSLFDERGQLLVGRAGVEIWSKECTSLFNAPQEQQAEQPEQQEQQAQQPDQQQQVAAHAGQPLDAAAAGVAPGVLQQLLQQQLDDEELPDDSSSEDEWHVVGPDVPPAGALVPVSHTRQVQMLHFLVDDVDESLWANGVCVDAMPAPPHACVPLLRMRLTLPALRGLFKEAAELEAVDIMQLLLD